MERILGCHASHVINVGAAEGYYAIGLLRCLPTVRGSAFETEVSYHTGTAEMARINQVGLDRLEIHGTCDAPALCETLRRADRERTVAVIDVEGAERDLLDLYSIPGTPARVPAGRGSRLHRSPDIDRAARPVSQQPQSDGLSLAGTPNPGPPSGTRDERKGAATACPGGTADQDGVVLVRTA